LHPQRDRSARTALRVVTNIRKPTVGTSRELSLKRRQTEGAMLDFEDDASAVLGFRLMAIQLPPPPGWRLTLPGTIAKLMRVRSAGSEVALLVSDGHLEIWSLENLRSALSAPPSEIV